jgi:hypothetical protein
LLARAAKRERAIRVEERARLLFMRAAYHDAARAEISEARSKPAAVGECTTLVSIPKQFIGLPP